MQVYNINISPSRESKSYLSKFKTLKVYNINIFNLHVRPISFFLMNSYYRFGPLTYKGKE
jgi:hypothetical protein